MLTQEVAWLQMLVAYTSERGLVRGVVETFDGEHPCAMCAQADELRKAEAGRNKPEQNQRDHSLSQMLAWAKMLAPTCLRIRDRIGADYAPEVMAAYRVAHGRSREAPVTPPPELG